MDSDTMVPDDAELDRLQPQIEKLRQMVEDRMDPLVTSLLRRVADLEEQLRNDRRSVVRRPLDPTERRLLVADLHGAGHSLRSIAGAAGTSVGTVQRDLAGLSPPGSAEP